MSKALRICLIWGLLLGVNFSATARRTPKGKRKPNPKITLRVYDNAGLPARLLSRALNQTSVIFGDAGVVVAPIFCTQDEPPAVCSQALDPSNIALRIIPGPVPGDEYNALGYSSGPYITVDYSRVEEVAARSDVSPDRILGCVVAHELGHVLLGPESHSAAGIMKARFTDKELRLIREMFIGFLPSQKERIRANVFSREGETRDLKARSIPLAQR